MSDQVDYTAQLQKIARKSAPEKGVLYLCATPIGNMGDITLRVLQCLKEADYIAVESSRRARKLLHYYDIRAPLLSYREANREKKGREILDRVRQGAKVALLTDAGLPAIADPGFHLVRMFLAEKVPFTVLPGPSATLTALLLSGYPTHRFVFWGFLSRKKKERVRELGELAAEQKTVVFYEAPHRLLQTLREMAVTLGEREIAVCREMTKKFEDVRRGSAAELSAYFSQEKPRGEITLVLSPQSRGSGKRAGGEGKAAHGACLAAGQGGGEEAGRAGEGKKNSGGLSPQLRAECRKMLQQELQGGAAPTAAVKKTARSFGLQRKEAYALLLDLKNRASP